MRMLYFGSDNTDDYICEEFADVFEIDRSYNLSQSAYLCKINSYDAVIIDSPEIDANLLSIIRKKTLKNFPVFLLSKQLQKGLIKSDQLKTKILRVADLVVNTDTHAVKRAGFILHLRQKEYRLLETLLLNRGQPVTYAKLIKSIWINDSYVVDGNLFVHVRNLRKKVDDPFEKKLIHTVRGVGYKISD